MQHIAPTHRTAQRPSDSPHPEMTRFAILPRAAYGSWFQSCFTCLPGIHVLALIYDHHEVVFLEFEFQHQTFRIQQFQEELWLTVRAAASIGRGCGN